MDKPKVIFETERLFIRSAEETDKEPYMNLRVAVSEVSKAYQRVPKYRDYEWKQELYSDNNIFMAVFLKGTDDLAALCSFQNYKSECIEFGFDVAERYRKQGIATELVLGMLREAGTLFPCRKIKIRTNASNAACRRVAEKCGAVLAGYEPDVLARALIQYMDMYGKEPTEDPKTLEKRREYTEYIENNMEGICVYEFAGAAD